MRIYGEPGLSIHTNKRLAGRLRKYHLFTFNSEGYADIDETKLKQKTIDKIKNRFKTETKEEPKKTEQNKPPKKK